MDILSFRQPFVLATLFVVTLATTSSEQPSVTVGDSGFHPDVWLWNVQEYPNPQDTPRSCRRYQRSFVCDPDDILLVEEANALDKLIVTARADTPCLCSRCNSTLPGVTISVALVKNIFLNYNALLCEDVRKFAEVLRQKWNFGNCDDDILILVSTGDNERHVDFGDTVAGFISKDTANRIFLESRNHFANKHYYQGLQSMIQSYSDVIRKEVLHRSSLSKKQSSLNLIVGLTVTFVVLVIVLAGLAFWWTKRKREREGRRCSWETSSSLKKGNIKVQGPYMPVKTADYQAPAMTERLKEGHLESLNEEEEMELEQMSEEEKQLEESSEDENVQSEDKSSQHKTNNEDETDVKKPNREEYFMPRNSSQTQWQQSSASNLDSTNL